MTDKEILAELKKSYEYLNDIRENGCNDHCTGQLGSDSAKSLEIAMNEIAEVYDRLRTEMSDDECEVKVNGETYVVGHTVSEDYCVLGEDYYATCEDLDYYWYDDKDFILGD